MSEFEKQMETINPDENFSDFLNVQITNQDMLEFINENFATPNLMAYMLNYLYNEDY